MVCQHCRIVPLKHLEKHKHTHTAGYTMVPFTLIRKPWFWCIGQIDRKKCIKQWVLRSDRVDCEELTCFFLTCWTPGKMRMFPDHQAYLGIHFGRIPPFVFFPFSSLFCGFAGRLIFLVDTPKKAAMRRGSCTSTMGSCTWKRLKRRIQLGWNAKAGEELSKTAGLVASWCHRLAPEGEVIVFQVVFQFLNRGGEQDGHYAWLPFLDATTFGSVVGWFFVRWFNGSQRIQGAC